MAKLRPGAGRSGRTVRCQLDGGTRRAMDYRAESVVDEAALTVLLQPAASYNSSLINR